MPTGNTQQVINYGASANDGQGDPLRTAFIKTDENFDNIWLAGPAGSNVRITDNTISAIDTNGNLVLSPNGVGVIQTNNTLVPRANRSYDLGSANLQYRAVYANTATFQTLSLPGDLTVGGNLTVQGNIIQVGNIVTETLTIQLANAATTGNAANGSGITVGASDNIATLLYNSTSNVWTTNIGVSATGNVTAPYFIGNGSQLTGITSSYGNSNVTVLLSNLGSNTISGTGNITTTANISGGFILGNVAFATGIPATYGNANVAANLAAFGSNPISTTGNITGGFILGNISLANGFPATYGNANVANYLPTFSGNISAGNISATGNVTGNYVLGNGSQLTGVTGNVTFSGEAVIGTGTSNTQSGLYLAPDPVSLANDLYLRVRGNILDEPTHIHFDTGNNQYYNLIIGDDNKYVQLANTGNIVINTNNYAGNTAQWTFDTDGRLTLPGANVDYTIATQGGYITVGNLLIGQGGSLFNSNNDSWALYGNLSDPGATIFIPSNADAGNGTALYIESQQSNVEIRSGSGTWNFGNTSNLTLPLGGVVSEGASPTGLGNTIALTPSGGSDADQQLLVYPTGNVVVDGNHLHLTTGNLLNTELYLGNDDFYVKLANTGNIVVNTAGNTAQWTFGTTGNLTLPGNAFAVNYANGTAISLGGNYGNANVATFLAAFGSNAISTTGNITASNFVGNISITGNVVGTQPNVTLVAGSYSTVFDNTGNLTLPGNTFSVNYANNTPVNVVTKFESSWTVPVGNSTQSFTVGTNETYYMWVDCNIPNGILAWNATGTVTNTNVPVVGAQYAWVYTGGGTPIDFTSIPNQFVGTSNTIVRSSVAPSATTNRFDFGINNTSAGNVTVRYGWIAIS